MSWIIGYGVFLTLFYGYMARVLKHTRGRNLNCVS